MLRLLRALFSALVDILLLRRGPENVPASFGLLAIVILANSAITLLFASQFPEAARPTPIRLAVGVALTLLSYRVILGLARKPERFLQTTTAVFGTQAIVAPVTVPISAAVLAGYLAKDSVTLPMLVLIGGGLLGVWVTIVSIYILKSATEWGIGGAIAVFLLQYFAVSLLLAALLGGLAPAN